MAERKTSPVMEMCPQNAPRFVTKGFNEKSCSKIYFVNVYPAKSPDQSKLFYAIIDEQSNRSLTRSNIFDMFSVQGTCALHTLKMRW